ncbi:hypothetical protein [Hymenobacter weizhouensis]|uniref:hypothetical protein n=1 Tax=Hymenobacter sp. YIM 151500-1 TaxID=2987689 RepID=UPI002226BDA3|nr:hypothetical protein [Hymenobacter sp. YIM 151500-1]UYZ64900.1 hypothetical protein OIS53_08620 [Hymenobacter sp. YIM 151500-1]
MSQTRYYRSITCGSLYRVRTSPATRAQPAGTWQARRSVRCPEAGFSPEYPTTPAEVARLVDLGLFLEVPAP